MERGFAGHLCEARNRPLVAQQRLRRHQDQRLAEVALQLTAQDMEVVRRGRDVGNLHVVFRTKLQEALQARRRVFRTLTFVTMRQQADETRHAQPLAFARRNELVEDDLRTVCEIAELRFPERERVRARQRIAVFEAENGLFGEHRVDDLVAGLRRRQVGERDITRFGLLIVKDRMALRESAAFAILTRKADLMAFEAECAKASASPIAQSMPSPVWIMLARFSMKRWIVRCALKPAGTSESLRPISFNCFIGTAVLPRRCSSALSAVRRPDHSPSSQSALFGL
ncbi:hypothetical protein AJ87_34715 [Rhizobium yanglingense]|nr:hypothetical protein AJ87_34715 [Rhizobium yanglingense]